MSATFEVVTQSQFYDVEIFCDFEVAFGKLHDLEIFYDFEARRCLGAVARQWLVRVREPPVDQLCHWPGRGARGVYGSVRDLGERRGVGEDQGGVCDFVQDDERGDA